MELVRKAIERKKAKLIKKAQTQGLSENFGQAEVRSLRDKYLDSSDYSAGMTYKRLLIDQFDDWCMNHSL